jgi:hypothetical protein
MWELRCGNWDVGIEMWELRCGNWDVGIGIVEVRWGAYDMILWERKCVSINTIDLNPPSPTLRERKKGRMINYHIASNENNCLGCIWKEFQTPPKKERIQEEENKMEVSSIIRQTRFDDDLAVESGKKERRMELER